MQFNEDQEKAYKQIKEWLDSDSKEFRLGGLAGTGKTSLAGQIIKKNPSALVAAFTGKAASRLREKGAQQAITLHKAFKNFEREEKDEYGNLQPVFSNSESEYGLAIIDEASMVNRDFYEQALSRCRKILWIGDHGQLPPVKGGGFCVMDEKHLDAKLTQIMRTGEGSGIPRIAAWIRSDVCMIFELQNALSKHNCEGVDFAVSDNGIAGAAQIAIESGCFPVIVPTHVARVEINKAYRQSRGIRPFETRVGEPLICISNRPSKNIMNGEIFRPVKNIGHERFLIQKDSDDSSGELIAVLAHQFGLKEENYPTDYIPCFDAYALTCHKAQGSEWDHVAVLMDSNSIFYRDEKWVYTALTRASKRVTIIFC